jgi:tetratricopeptide (TPR) repeat protein
LKRRSKVSRRAAAKKERAIFNVFMKPSIQLLMARARKPCPIIAPCGIVPPHVSHSFCFLKEFSEVVMPNAKSLLPLSKLAGTYLISALGAGPLSLLPLEGVQTLLQGLLGQKVADQLGELSDDIVGELAGEYASELLKSLRPDPDQDLRKLYLRALHEALASTRAQLREAHGQTLLLSQGKRELADTWEQAFANWLQKIEEAQRDQVECEMLFSREPLLEQLVGAETEDAYQTLWWGFFQKTLERWDAGAALPQEFGRLLRASLPPNLATALHKLLAEERHAQALRKYQTDFLNLIHQQARRHEQKTDIANEKLSVLIELVLELRDQANADKAAPTIAIQSLHQLPAPPSDFTGRERELNELLANLDQGVTISGMHGLGGIGKTALALKLAERIQDRCPDAQLYLDLQGAGANPLSPARALEHVIRAYHPTAKLPESLAELSAIYRSTLHGQRALIVMDNARDRAQVEPLIPPAGCVLLVTSRQHFTLPGMFDQNLDALPRSDAITLLRTIAGRIGDHADEIARLCGDLPLALRVAASALADRPNLTPSDYALRLADTKQRLSHLKEVEVALNLSYEMLDERQRQWWRALAVFPQSFDDAAVAAVWEMERDTAQDALGDLMKWSLVEFSAETGRYRLHDLARLFAEARLAEAEAGEVGAAQRRFARHYCTVLETCQSLYLEGNEAVLRGLALFDQEWSNIQSGQAWAEARREEDWFAVRLCLDYPNVGAEVLSLRHHPRERIHWLEAQLAAARELKQRDDEANALGNLGIAWADLGELRKAIEFLEQNLAIKHKIGDREGECFSVVNLGSIYGYLGEMRKAVEFFEQGLVIAREIGNHGGEGSALQGLGSAHYHLGETHKAIEYHEQALAIVREIGDRRHEGSVLGNIGGAWAALGETRKATKFYEQQLAIAREIGDRRGEGFALWNMSVCVDRLGDRARAIALAEAALKIREEIESPLAERVRKRLAEWRGQS